MGLKDIRIDWSAVLSGVACAGVFGTGYFGFKAGEKNAEKKDWKNYILPGVTGLVTCASIIGAHKISAGQIAALTATAGYLAANRDGLKRALDSQYKYSHPDDPEGSGDASMCQPSYVEYDIPKAAEDTGKGKELCLEAYSGRWFLSSEEDVKTDIQRFVTTWCANVKKNGSYACPFNDLYVELGIEPTHFGWRFGYSNTDGCYDYTPKHISFHVNKIGIKGQPVIVIEPADDGSYPFEGWWEI